MQEAQMRSESCVSEESLHASFPTLSCCHAWSGEEDTTGVK